MTAHRRPSLAIRAVPDRPSARAARSAAAILVAALLGACSPGADLPPLPAYDGTVYRLGVGDQLRLLTFGEQSLSQEFRIGDGGNIAVPLLGTVKAAGLTTTELSQTIEASLKARQLLRNPSVVVEVVTYRPISVLGEVAKPGQYPYQPSMTMLTAIAAAGGFTYRSVESRAYVVRTEEPKTVTGNIVPQDFVKPGDVIKVYERVF